MNTRTGKITELLPGETLADMAARTGQDPRDLVALGHYPEAIPNMKQLPRSFPPLARVAVAVAGLALLLVLLEFIPTTKPATRDDIRSHATATVRTFWPDALVCPTEPGVMIVRHNHTLHRLEYRHADGFIQWTLCRPLTAAEVAALNP